MIWLYFVEAVDTLLHLVADCDDSGFAARLDAAHYDTVVARVVDFVGVKYDEEGQLEQGLVDCNINASFN